MRWQVLTFLSGLGLTLLVGLLIGFNVLGAEESPSQDMENAYAAGSDKTVAVVNLDSGVQDKNKSRSYSTPIIDTLDSEYKIVPYKMAQKGLADGAYDAVVCFPTDFSRKASSVNARNPEKIELDYEINKIMPEDRYIETYSDIVDLQTYVNGSLSYAYIYSIYDEFHLAQGKTSKLFANDKKDMTEVENIKEKDFRDVLDMKDMPEIELALKELDFDTYVKNVKNYANDMSNVYLSSYGNAKKAYDDIAKQVTVEADAAKGTGEDLVSDIESWRVDAGKWRTNVNKFVDKYNEDATLINPYSNNFNDNLRIFYQYLEDFVVDDGQFEKLNNYYEAVDQWRKDLNTNIVNTVNKQITEANKAVAKGETADTIAPVVKPDEISPTAIGLQDFNNMQELIVSYQAFMLDHEEQEFKQPTFNQLDHIDDSPLFKEEPTKQLTEELSKLKETSLSHDPLAYLTQDDKNSVSSIASNYQNEITTVKGNLDTSQTENLTMIDDAHSKYNEHINKLRTDTADSYTKEHKNVEDLVKGFIRTKNSTSSDNKRLLESFSRKMPNSKANASVNNKLVDFISEPVKIVKGDIRDQVKKEVKRNNIYMAAGAGLCLIMMIASIAMIIRSRRTGEVD